jgi:hypothetical protein
MSISLIGGSTSVYSSAGNQTQSKQGVVQDTASQASYNQTINTNSLTVLSLNQAPGTGPDITQNDLLAEGLANAINGATTVDPVTGQHELRAGAGGSLTTAVTKLLTDNGFSDDEAQAAAKELNKELQNGGNVLLSLDQSSDVTTESAAALSNGSGSAEGAQITSSDYASRVTIGIDLSSGKLAVATQSQSSFTQASASEQSGSAVGAGLQSLTNGQSRADGISAYVLSVSSSANVQAFLNPSEQKKSNLQQLIENLSDPTIANNEKAQQAVARLSRLAAGARHGDKPDSSDTAAPGISINPDGTASTSVDVRVPAAIRQTDKHGYGSTLYRRPDGSLGTFTVKPTRLDA